MKTTLLFFLALHAAALSGLAGCGQRGPLYLPETESRAEVPEAGPAAAEDPEENDRDKDGGES